MLLLSMHLPHTFFIQRQSAKNAFGIFHELPTEQVFEKSFIVALYNNVVVVNIVNMNNAFTALINIH